MKLVVVDYGSGNLRSVGQALMAASRLRECDIDMMITADPDIVADADAVVLPGVGAFGDCAAGISSIDGMKAAITETVMTKARPFLGICVGMQLMATTGLEGGETPGFDWISGTVTRLNPNSGQAIGQDGGQNGGQDGALKIPHMGWNSLTLTAEHDLWQGVERGAAVYFLHSYAVTGADHVLAETDYGGPVIAAIGQDNFVGLQFHPEKSQSVGQQILGNWLTWKP